jgi:hypothetical protein
MKRLLFPPMMSLLTCPGHGHLGRGQATIPSDTLTAVGLPSALSTLAEDAVRAAFESPFLDDKMHGATAVLCVLCLSRGLFDNLSPGTPAQAGDALLDSTQERALRLAMQVGCPASALRAGSSFIFVLCDTCCTVACCSTGCSCDHPGAMWEDVQGHHCCSSAMHQ